MSTAMKPLRWSRAISRAEVLCELLAEACVSIEIAGSLRRREPLVRDIELVAVPKRITNLLGEEADSRLDTRIGILQRGGILSPFHKAGDRYKQFTLLSVAGDVDHIQVDLFIATPTNVGLIMALRTGPAAFSKRLVQQHAHGGLLTDGLSVDQGSVWRGRQYDDRNRLTQAGEAIPTPDERAFFALTTCGWIEPHDRKEALR